MGKRYWPASQFAFHSYPHKILYSLSLNTLLYATKQIFSHHLHSFFNKYSPPPTMCQVLIRALKIRQWTKWAMWFVFLPHLLFSLEPRCPTLQMSTSRKISDTFSRATQLLLVVSAQFPFVQTCMHRRTRTVMYSNAYFFHITVRLYLGHLQWSTLLWSIYLLRPFLSLLLSTSPNGMFAPTSKSLCSWAFSGWGQGSWEQGGRNKECKS